MTQKVSVMGVVAFLALSAHNVFVARSDVIDAKYIDDANNFANLEVLKTPDDSIQLHRSQTRGRYELFALQIAVFANMLGRMARDDDREAKQHRRHYPNLDDGDVVLSSEAKNEFQNVLAELKKKS
jgi:hypothetical protein